MTLSILYINICSLNANLENLELPLNNLEHSFDIIAVSETWTPKIIKTLIQQEILLAIKSIMVLREQ